VAIGLYDDAGAPLAHATLPAPTGNFVEVAFDVRATRASLQVVTQAFAPYRVFHWFVLQPDPSTPAPR